MKFSFLGAGIWGSVLAWNLHHQGHVVKLWRRHVHGTLAYDALDTLNWCTQIDEAIDDSDIYVIASSSMGFVPIFETIIKTKHQPLIWLCKGLDVESGLLFDEYIEKRGYQAPVGFLSGPTFAHDVWFQKPTIASLSSFDQTFPYHLSQIIQNTTFKIEAHHDIRGSQVCSIMKNIFAVVMGMADVLDFSSNTRAWLWTLCMQELRRAVMAFGGHSQTCFRPEGTGDLFMSASESKSRNRSIGMLIAQSIDINHIDHQPEAMHHIVSFYQRILRMELDLPIVKLLADVIKHRRPPDIIRSSILNILENG